MRKRNYKKTKTKSELHTHTYNTIDERGKLLRIFQATNREGGTRTRERAFSFESLEYIKGWRAGRFCCRRGIYWVGKERDLSDIFFFCSTVASFLRYHRETLPFLFFTSLRFASLRTSASLVEWAGYANFAPTYPLPPFLPFSLHIDLAVLHIASRDLVRARVAHIIRQWMDAVSLLWLFPRSVGRSVSQSVVGHDTT